MAIKLGKKLGESGYLHAPTSLSLGKEHLVPTRRVHESLRACGDCLRIGSDHDPVDLVVTVVTELSLCGLPGNTMREAAE
jgi:hypothetical protein